MAPTLSVAQPQRMELTRLQQLMNEQDGVVSRRQVIECGGDDNVIERRLRSREWATLHRGVYVDHTGPPSWRQRAWAAVLYHWPSALCHVSALRLHGLAPLPATPDEPIHVAVDATRRPRSRVGIRPHRIARLHERVQPNRRPPRFRLEDAVLDVASDTDDDAQAVAVLADACQSRRTTAGRLCRALAARPRLRRRRFLILLLTDVATGAYSVLEHRYLTRVERPHGLPTGRRQRVSRAGRGAAYRDVEYEGLGVVVELDGRLGHDFQADRWDDLDRDIASLVGGDVTIRAGWRQVLQPCRLAEAVARLLIARGWAGSPRACGPGCPVSQVRGRLPAA
jgi:hypothetical protein